MQVVIASTTKTFTPTDADTELGTQFTRFTSTKVQILTQIYYSDDNLQQWGQINTNYRIGEGYKGPG